ncbi:alpha/beta hydrolase family protein [Empedobacter brevis]|uniref:alpha/beta hydrolase family protein n=1 Tax=Empedobacter brevis TaxID=247 RepID=UPI0039AE9662
MAQTVKEFSDSYKDYHISTLYEQSPNLDWMIVRHLYGEGKVEYELVSLEKNRTSRLLPETSSFKFTSDSVLVYQLPNKEVVFENLYTRKKKKFEGVINLIHLPSSQTLILKPIDLTEMIITDANGKVKHYLKHLKNNRIDFISQKIYFETDAVWNVLDLKQNKTNQLFNFPTVDWLHENNTKWIGLKKENDQMRLMEKDKSNQIISESIILPPNPSLFTENYITNLEIREERYLLFKLALENKKNQLAEISYTNQYSPKFSSSLQLGIYDLQEKKWTWEPDKTKPYQRQKFLTKGGDFMLFDQALNVVDTLTNDRLPMHLVRDYGRIQQPIANQYTHEFNYYYDPNTDYVLYFEKGRWKSENLSTHEIKEAPFEANVILVNGKYNNLGDVPKEKITPTFQKGIFIVKSEYDLYSWDILKNTIQLLTNGASDQINYELKEQPLWIMGESPLNVVKNRPVDLKKPLLVRGISMKDYTTNLGIIKGNKFKIIAQSDFTIKDFEGGERIVYTTSGYNEPLKIYEVKGNKSDLKYASKGMKTGTRPPLKKKLLHYTVDGQELNAYLFYPIDYDSTKVYPMVVRVYEKLSYDFREDDIPSLFSGIGFNFMHYVYNGYFVLIPDLAYKVNDSQKTAIKSIEYLINDIKSIPQIDSKHIGLTGQSFGGYEAALFMGTTNLFATAMIGVPVIDIPRKYLTEYKFNKNFYSDYAREERQQTRMNSSLFDNWQGYLEASPIYHVKKVQKPLLLWGGSLDENILPEQVRSYFYGLTRVRKKAVYLNYPDEGHSILKKQNRLDLNYKVWQWMEHFLKGKPAADWIQPMLEN